MEAVANILRASFPGATDPGMPIFLAQGAHDAEIPPAVTKQLAAATAS